MQTILWFYSELANLDNRMWFLGIKLTQNHVLHHSSHDLYLFQGKDPDPGWLWAANKMKTLKGMLWAQSKTQDGINPNIGGLSGLCNFCFACNVDFFIPTYVVSAEETSAWTWAVSSAKLQWDVSDAGLGVGTELLPIAGFGRGGKALIQQCNALPSLWGWMFDQTLPGWAPASPWKGATSTSQPHGKIYKEQLKSSPTVVHYN